MLTVVKAFEWCTKILYFNLQWLKKYKKVPK